MSRDLPKIEIGNLEASFAGKRVLGSLSLDVLPGEILGIIGPAKSGKSTLLKCLNRTIELVPGAQVKGTIRIDGEDVTRMRNVHALRRRIGMVFPLPVGRPISVYENVAYAPRAAGVVDREKLDGIVQRCLRQAALWDEVKDRLGLLGTRLSGGQQQRLTIARALSHDPEILCLDEFSIAVDPVTTMRIEDALLELKEKGMTIVLVTNLVQQARRLADRTAFLNSGRLVEVDRNEVIFSDTPAQRETYEYVNGIFG